MPLPPSSINDTGLSGLPAEGLLKWEVTAGMGLHGQHIRLMGMYTQDSKKQLVYAPLRELLHSEMTTVCSNYQMLPSIRSKNYMPCQQIIFFKRQKPQQFSTAILGQFFLVMYFVVWIKQNQQYVILTSHNFSSFKTVQ